MCVRVVVEVTVVVVRKFSVRLDVGGLGGQLPDFMSKLPFLHFSGKKKTTTPVLCSSMQTKKNNMEDSNYSTQYSKT